MSNKKIERALYGPGWGEVFFGAVLSLVLGVVLGTVFLIVRPAVKVKEMSEASGLASFHYIEGTRDASRSRTAAARRQEFARGGATITVNEDELNTMVISPAAGPAAKDAPAAADGMFTAGTPNFRIADGKLQVALPSSLNLAGFSIPVQVTTRGGFERAGETVEYRPDEFWVGSLNAGRLPFLQSYIRGKVMESQRLPSDFATAWERVTDAQIQDRTLTLTLR